MWQCASTRPGSRNLPVASTTVAPRGTGTRARGPADRIRSPSTITTASSIGGAPVPSISRAPAIAIGAAARSTCPSTLLSAAAANTARARSFIACVGDGLHAVAAGRSADRPLLHREYPDRAALRHVGHRPLAAQHRLHGARIDAPARLHRDVLLPLDGKRRRLADDPGVGR